MVRELATYRQMEDIRKKLEQEKVEEAYRELKRLENVRVDGANPADVNRHKEQYKEAKKITFEKQERLKFITLQDLSKLIKPHQSEQ